MALLIVIVPSGLLSFLSQPLIFHCVVIALGTVVFSASEIAFRNVITEANSIFRRGGYSLWQAEKLFGPMVALRKQVWLYWYCSLFLKAVVAILLGSISTSKNVSKAYESGIVFGCYAALSFGFLLSLWAGRNYRKLEAAGDALFLREVAVKEEKRLKTEIAGQPHDFANDSALQGYTKTVGSVQPL
jgi:hypothetical protein